MPGRAAGGARAAQADAERARRREQANVAVPDEDRRATKRVVLKRERVLVLPDGVEPGALDELRAARKHGRVVEAEAWVEVAQATGDKRKAIEAHAGVAGTPDAKPGVYKAPTLTAWKGGRRYERPEQPKVEARDID